MKKLLGLFLVFLVFGFIGAQSCLRVECPPDSVYSPSAETCLPLGPDFACENFPEKVTCLQRPGCVWQNNKCSDKNPDVPVIPSDIVVCNKMNEQAKCLSSGCVWEPGNNSCLEGDAFCSAAVSESVCNALYACVWNADVKSCDDVKDSCEPLDKTACNSSFTCVYDDEQSKCLSKLSFCSSATSKTLCEAGLIGNGTCTWDPASNVCLSAYDSCDLVQDPTTCDKAYLCSYDADTKQCVSDLLPCSSYGEKEICPTSSGCVWDNGCYSNSALLCTSRTSKIACEQGGCAWNASNQTCLSPTTSSCSEAKEESPCEQLGCLWSNNTCISSYSNCSSRSESVCAGDKSCSWDKSTSQCISPYWPCRSYSVDKCPTDSGCEIAPGTFWGTTCRSK